jgi:hypothetical protein
MKIKRKPLFVLCACLLLLSLSGLAQPVPPDAATRAQAIQMGTNQNKMILLLVSNTNGCIGCIELEDITLPSTNPPVRQFLAESFIYWSCGPQEHCTEFQLYTGTGTFGLPWFCLIDPYNPQTNTVSASGFSTPSSFYSWLRRGLLMGTAPIITNLANGQTITTSNIVVQGRSLSTNVPIAKVFYQLNNNPWGSSNAASGGLNWSAPLVASQVVQGQNVFRVYAVDSTSTRSRTNVLSFVYTPNGPSDTLAPNLEIASHSNLQQVAASAITLSGMASDGGRGDSGIASVTVNGSQAANDTAVGSAVANWSRVVTLLAGTNRFTVLARNTLGNAVTNVIRVISDTVRPTLAITSPKPGQKVNAVMAATGTASDNAQVAVKYQLNSNAWAVATGTTNWSAAMSLLKGTNVLRAYAQDMAGNTSTTNIVSFVSTNNFQMDLSFGSAHPLIGTGLDLYLQVTPGLNCRIESSTNLVFWTMLTNFVGTNVPVHFRDSAAPNYSRRFYRAVSP